MPNGSLMQSSVINHSAYSSRKIEVIVGVSYDDDIDEAEAVNRDSIVRHRFCLSTPEAIAGVDSHSEFGQNILGGVWVQSDLIVSGQMQLLREIKSAFDKGKITIPFLHYELEHLSI